MEIAQLVAEGRRNAKIASILGMSIKTVETPAPSSWLASASRVAGLVRYAIRVGLVAADK